MFLNPIHLRTLTLLLFVGLSVGVLDVAGQTRRNRRSRRVSRPVITNPTIADPNTSNTQEGIISTADENSEEAQQSSNTDESTAGAKTTRNSSKPKTGSEQEQMQQTINSLSNQVERLTNKLNQMQESDRTLLDMERLTRAEQRAENLRSQLVDVETKLADLQAKLDQIEYAIKPENIERAAAGFGSVHPEETREARRRQLESERNRALAQVKILETSRTRLQGSLVIADAEVDRLRQRLESREQQDAASSSSASDAQKSRKPDQ